MSLLQKNTRRQGDVGLGQAIAYFTSLGYSVSLPLTESQRYDLIVDDGEELARIEVKSSRYTVPANSRYPDTSARIYQVQLATCGGNMTNKGKIRKIDALHSDYVFIFTESGDRYLIPTSELSGRANLKLSGKWSKYLLP